MPTPISVLLNILINSIPILVVLIPLPFIRKKIFKKLYLRFFWGIVIFFLIYYLLPTIFQVQDPIDEMILGEGEIGEIDVFAGIFYMFGRTATLITNYFQFPIINLSFIFIFAPVISILFLWSIIRKEDKLGFRKNLAEVTLEIKKSPGEIISEKLNKGNWNEEKQLFKLLIVLLPISLYLLTTIMKIAEIPLSEISSASGLGWFIEIFFVYLATFLFGIHLLKASNVSFKGRFIGEKLLEDTSSSLTSVGIPISILSIVLFLVEYLDQMFLVIYFFGYFLMTAFIFVSLLAVFEPISTVILVKIIDAIKKKPQKTTKKKTKKEDKGMDYLYPLIFGAVGSLLMIIFVFILGQLSALATGVVDYSTITASANFELVQSLENATQTEIIQVIWNLGLVILMLLIGFLLSYSIKMTKKIGFSSILFSVIFLLIIFVANIPFEGLISLLFSTDAQWITGKLVTTDVFGGTDFIYTMRTAFLDATSEVPILEYLALPYNLVRFFMAFILWGIIFYYARKQFLTKMIRREKLVDQITFSNLEAIPAGEKFLTTEYLIMCTPDCKIPTDEKEGAITMIETFRDGKFSPEILQDSLEENKKIYSQLKYLTDKKYIQWWVAEFTFSFERAQMDSLYIINSDGRDVVSYRFAEGESKADPALVAGMFSAITSFIKETTKSSDLLRTIDHGDSKISIEYGKYVFGAIFADMETTEIRTNLKNFLIEFEKRHGDVLKDWNGATGPFKENDRLVEEIFQI